MGKGSPWITNVTTWLNFSPRAFQKEPHHQIPTNDWILLAEDAVIWPFLLGSPAWPSPSLLCLLGSQAMFFSSLFLLAGFLALSTSPVPALSLSILHVCHDHYHYHYLPVSYHLFSFLELRGTESDKSCSSLWYFLVKDLYMAFLYLLFS